MKQYCRYCAFCCEGDGYTITWHEISRNYFKAVTNNGKKLYARRGPNVGR